MNTAVKREGSHSADNRLSGSIQTITFHDQDSGYCVLRVAVSGQKDPVTVIGKVASVTPGEQVNCTGEWTRHAKHGTQFKAASVATTTPTSADGILKYLSSGMVRDIGPKMAQRMVDKWGDKTLEVMDSKPELLKSLPGIGPKRYKQLVSAWSEQSAIRDIMIFLQMHGLGAARAVKVYKIYGDNAVEKVKENPYRLSLDIHGIGFKIADDIAQKLGIPHDSDIRARAGLQHILKEMTGKGHCAVPREELITEAKRILGIPDSTVASALQAELRNGSLVQDEIDSTQHIYPLQLYRAERSVAQQFKRLSQGELPWGTIATDKALDWVQERVKISLAESQKEAIVTTLNSKVTVITGGPGVGKTTISRSVLDIIAAKRMRITLCAPTGRAAKRLSESTGRPASTIHRLLEFNPKEGFKRNKDNPLETDLVLCDEASMADLLLTNHLLKAIPDHAALVIVGDRDQLPSVGPGSILRDVIASKSIPVVYLTEIFRQAAGSRIITNAHLINAGEMPVRQVEGEKSDFYFFPVDDTDAEPAEVASRVFRAVLAAASDRVPRLFGFDPIKDVQVLTAMNGGPLGVQALNTELQAVLNPRSDNLKITRFGVDYATGDKVIQLRNDYDRDVFNGDMGFICEVDPKEGTLVVDFEDRKVLYSTSDLDELSLAYAKSIHRSQGSEYPVVIIPVTTQHSIMLERQLIYTGITRGKQLVIVIGQERAMKKAVKTAKSLERKTNLVNLLGA